MEEEREKARAEFERVAGLVRRQFDAAMKGIEADENMRAALFVSDFISYFVSGLMYESKIKPERVGNDIINGLMKDEEGTGN